MARTTAKMVHEATSNLYFRLLGACVLRPGDEFTVEQDGNGYWHAAVIEEGQSGSSVPDFLHSPHLGRTAEAYAVLSAASAALYSVTTVRLIERAERRARYEGVDSCKKHHPDHRNR